MKASVLTCLFLLSCAFPTLAASPSSNAAVASDQYRQAIAHLTDGHFFESAITELQAAVSLEPTDSDYHLALGCAEVSRAGSLAYAAWATDQFENDNGYGAIPEWEQGQRDPKSPWYGLPRPVLPKPYFQTKDDLKTLRFTGRQATAQIIALGLAAQTEWKQGVALASTPMLRAQAESVQGWGLLYERVLLRATGYPESKVPEAPKPAQVVAAFQAAIKGDPTQSAYWEGLAYAYENVPEGDTLSPDIVRAYQKALNLSPGSIALRYHLYLLQCHDLSHVGSDRKTPAETLRPLAEAAPGNAFLQYALAAVLFKQAQEYDNFHSNNNQPGIVPVPVSQADTEANRRLAQEAITAIERGNTAPDYEEPKYAPPVPRILSQAWRYWDHGDPNRVNQMALVRSAARGVAGYAQIAAQQGDAAEAVRALQACVGWGRRMIQGPTEEPDAVGRDRSGMSAVARQSLGCAVAAIGLTELKRVYEQNGNGAEAQTTTEELTAMKAQQKAVMDALTQSIASSHDYDDY